MGLLDIFKPQPQSRMPVVISILPDIAQKEIMQGRLPILNTDKIFLKKDEQCHYIDKAIYEKEKVKKRYVRHNRGYSTRGFFKGSRISSGRGYTDVIDNVEYEYKKGILFITNKRIIFVGQSEGFDRKVDDLVAITPYANCVELQFSKDNYKLFVPNGNITNAVLQQIR